MAAKPKMTPEQWASTRATWEADPRKALPWLIHELGLPVSAEALRLRARSEGWAKTGETEDAKLAPKPKLAELPRPKLAPEVPSLDGNALADSRGAALTPREDRFVREYLIDLNATQAYLRGNPHVKEVTASTEGSRFLGNPKILAAIERAKAERAARTGITADRALAEVWAVATADARELVQVKVGCCRHCHGEGHKRQRTVGEMNAEREKYAVKSKDLADFDEEGGIGFNPLRPPHPECPDCGGDGRARTVLMDTRNLSPQAAMLYAGAKETKFGVEVTMHSKADAMDKVFRHLGLYEKEIPVNLNVFPPKEVLDAIYAKSLKEAAEMEKMLIGRRERLGIVFENRGGDGN